MIDRARMQQMGREVSLTMPSAVFPFLTPISGQESGKEPIAVGTGGYLALLGRRLLLTNEHVAVFNKTHQLARRFFGSDNFVRVSNSFHVASLPFDLAASGTENAWGSVPHQADAIPETRLAQRHDPLPGEFLYFRGFAGEKSYYSATYDVLANDATSVTTQEYLDELADQEQVRKTERPEFDPVYHFALLWNPAQSTVTTGRVSDIPHDPHGFSGSFVWNTRRLECEMKQIAWTPEMAVLTGVIWGWDTTAGLLFATRIEHVRAFLTKVVPQMPR